MPNIKLILEDEDHCNRCDFFRVKPGSDYHGCHCHASDHFYCSCYTYSTYNSTKNRNWCSLYKRDIVEGFPPKRLKRCKKNWEVTEVKKFEEDNWITWEQLIKEDFSVR